LNEPLAGDYWRQLFSAFPEELPRLIAAYRRVNPEGKNEPLGDALLQRLQGTREFEKHRFVARQIVNIWYLSQFNSDERPAKSEVVDGGRFERGLVWTLIKAHPVGFTTQPYGHWTTAPRAG